MWQSYREHDQQGMVLTFVSFCNWETQRTRIFFGVQDTLRDDFSSKVHCTVWDILHVQ